MSEQGDYYIEKVHYNPGHTKIMWISVRQDSSDKLGKARTMERKTMIGLIQDGGHFLTIFRNEEGKYRKGQKIGLIRIKGVDYIRTDHEATAQDLLENIPEF
jgi:hypothetical protein